MGRSSTEYSLSLNKILLVLHHDSVADPGYPRGGCQLLRECANLLFCKILAENCKKMIEFRPRGDARPLYSPV